MWRMVAWNAATHLTRRHWQRPQKIANATMRRQRPTANLARNLRRRPGGLLWDPRRWQPRRWPLGYGWGCGCGGGGRRCSRLWRRCSWRRRLARRCSRLWRRCSRRRRLARSKLAGAGGKGCRLWAFTAQEGVPTPCIPPNVVHAGLAPAECLEGHGNTFHCHDQQPPQAQLASQGLGILLCCQWPAAGYLQG